MSASLKILYICTHNRCRSILAEAISNLMSDGRIIARSAGSEPAGMIHPLTLHYLHEAGVSTEGLYSKSWDELESFEPDVVITVCDAAAQESCPLWFGKALKVHWGLEDPSKVSGELAQARAFRSCIARIKRRVAALLELRFDKRDSAQLQARLQQLETV
jgi:arsenate reductase